MGQQPCFYHDDDDWQRRVERLKLTPCPHCRRVGALVRHGALRGFDERNPRRKTVRARRIFCSNRNARPGCGRTFSVWAADTIRRLGLTTGGLWQFLRQALARGLLAAIADLRCHLSDRTLLRVWKRFRLGQSKIRMALLQRCPPPPLPREQRPAAQVLAHLRAAFPDAACPVAAFQHTMRTFFV
jgi:hypothetical protein